MISFEEMGVMLDDIAHNMPQEIFILLNGGVNLLQEAKPHPESRHGDLFIMGEYHYNSLGRYINIYYGSIMQVYHYLSPEKLKEKITDILKHEFTHHLESLAGEKDLIIKDTIYMEKYKNR